MTMFLVMGTAAKTIKAGEFKAKCLELMDQVADSGQSIVITKRGKAVARLAPVLETRSPLFGFLKGNFTFVGDLVSPIDVEWGPAHPVLPPRRPSAPSTFG